MNIKKLQHYCQEMLMTKKAFLPSLKSLQFIPEKIVRGNTFFTSNQCESLHSALNRFYKTPPSTIRAASLTLNDYKKDFLMKFSNQFFNPRRADTMEKAELVLFHHHQIMAQPPEWRLENAMDICRQFTLYFAPILSPYPFSSSFDCYEPSSDFINL